MLTPQDIKNKTFTKGFRGYEVEEVDKLLPETACGAADMVHL